MLYAALGDSITCGYCAKAPDDGFVQRVCASLSKQQPTNVFLNAKPGWTSRHLLKSLEKVPDCIWAEARLVTILIGGNDLLRQAPWLLDGNLGRLMTAADRFQERLTRIVQHVQRPQSTLILATLYNPFPHSLMAEEFTNAMNKAIHFVAKRERAVLADLRAPFAQRESELVDGYRRGQLGDFRLKGNPIHPNDHGHDVIARAYLRAYRQSLVAVRHAKQKTR